jgi:hypothetical protein
MSKDMGRLLFATLLDIRGASIDHFWTPVAHNTHTLIASHRYERIHP